MDTQNDTTEFMALIAHELSHVFHMINAASACALDNPDKRYLEDIRRASAAGQSLLRQITLLSRSRDSERHPLRKHRIRALRDAIQRTCRSTPADVRLLDDGFIIADMPILEDALHQMLALARHGNAKPNVTAAVVNDNQVEISVRWPSNHSWLRENVRAGIGIRFLEQVAQMHDGSFGYEDSELSRVTINIPLQ